MAFGNEVKRLRELKQFSQKTLAGMIGVKQAFVSKLELIERARLGADVYLRLCDALGVGCDHFRKYLIPSPDAMADTSEPPAEKPKMGRPRKKPQPKPKK